jgi:hypothetical protein
MASSRHNGHSHTFTAVEIFDVVSVHKQVAHMGAQCVLVTIKAQAQKGKQCVREDRDVYLREIWLLHKDGPMPTGAHALCTFSEDGACMAADYHAASAAPRS